DAQIVDGKRQHYVTMGDAYECPKGTQALGMLFEQQYVTGDEKAFIREKGQRDSLTQVLLGFIRNAVLHHVRQTDAEEFGLAFAPRLDLLGSHIADGGREIKDQSGDGARKLLPVQNFFSVHITEVSFRPQANCQEFRHAREIADALFENFLFAVAL